MLNNKYSRLIIFVSLVILLLVFWLSFASLSIKDSNSDNLVLQDWNTVVSTMSSKQESIKSIYTEYVGNYSNISLPSTKKPNWSLTMYEWNKMINAINNLSNKLNQVKESCNISSFNITEISLKSKRSWELLELRDWNNLIKAINNLDSKIYTLNSNCDNSEDIDETPLAECPDWSATLNYYNIGSFKIGNTRCYWKDQSTIVIETPQICKSWQNCAIIKYWTGTPAALCRLFGYIYQENHHTYTLSSGLWGTYYSYVGSWSYENTSSNYTNGNYISTIECSPYYY